MTDLVHQAEARHYPELQTAAHAIKGEHRQVEESLRAGFSNALVHAVEAGRKLKYAKSLVAHGQWGPWVEGSLAGVSPRTERLYRQLAEAADDGRLAIGRGSASLTLEGALKQLAASRSASVEGRTARARSTDNAMAKVGARLGRLARHLWRNYGDDQQLAEGTAQEIAAGFADHFEDDDEAAAYCGWLRRCVESIEAALEDA